MSGVLRRRIPWNQAAATVEEGIELEDLGEASQIAEVASVGSESNPLLAGVTGEIDTIKNISGASELLGQAITGSKLGWKDIFESAKSVVFGDKKGKGLKKNPKVKGKGLKKLKQDQNKSDKSFDYTETKENDPNDFVLLDGLNPPPFKYLGPGNSLNKGKPYNNIDADAKTHDITYAKAKNPEEIRKADDTFLQKASDHISEGLAGKGSISDTVGSIVGGLGIGAKRLIENKTGILYPKLSGKYVFICKTTTKISAFCRFEETTPKFCTKQLTRQ